MTESITTDEALEIIHSAESTYVPEGHTFTMYPVEDLMTTYGAIMGGAFVAFAIIWLLMRTLGGGRY